MDDMKEDRVRWRWYIDQVEKVIFKSDEEEHALRRRVIAGQDAPKHRVNPLRVGAQAAKCVLQQMVQRR